MKKLIILIACLLAFSFAEAQMATTTIRSGNTYADLTTDFTLTNAVTQYWFVKAPQHWYTTQTLVINLDSLAGDHTNVAIQLQGKVSDQITTWTNIGSAINWLGTTSDTTIIYDNSTENNYRRFKILYTGTGTGTTTIDRQEFIQHFGTP